MNTALKLVAATALAILSLTTVAAGPEKPYSLALTDTYSQRELLKNWALSVCIAAIAKDAQAREDANATASAYLEFGHQPIEAYDALRNLVDKWVAKRYSGSIPSEWNTMKCIDMYHSRELNQLVAKLEKKR